jgi:hypothetical protein
MSSSAENAERPERDQAAIFVDFDNLHSILNTLSLDDGPTARMVDLVDELRRYLEEGDDTPTSVTRAYADYGLLSDERDASDIQRDLHTNGIEPSFVPATIQSNAPELQLCVDATSFIHERPDVDIFVIATGDRLYLPLVRRLREHGRRILVAALFPPRPDAEGEFAEDDVFLDARNLLGSTLREKLESYTPQRNRREAPSSGPRVQRDYYRLEDPMAVRTVEVAERHFGQYKEIYLTPLLRKLSEVLGDEHNPKSLVSKLEAAGAVRLEKREGYPYDYTVLILHSDHPDVQRVQNKVHRGTASDRPATPNATNGTNGASAEGDGSPGDGSPSDASSDDRATGDRPSDSPRDADDSDDGSYAAWSDAPSE